MPAQRYRDLQRASVLETGVVQQNAGTAASRLAQTFKDFEVRSASKLADLSAQQGMREGTEAGQRGDPQLRTGLKSLTAYGRAYNNAALRSYLIKAEGDANQTAARLETEAANDPGKFNITFGKVRDEVLKTVEPSVRPALAEVFQRRLSDGLVRLEAGRANEVKAEQRSTTAEGINQIVDRLGRLRASDDPALMEQADEEEAKLNLLIDGAANDGTLSIIEAQALKVDAARSVVKATVSARFARELDNPYGDPVGFIEKLREANKKSEALPPEEEAKLMDGLLADLRERNALANIREQNTLDALKLRYAAGEKFATEQLLSGTLRQRDILRLTEGDYLDPSVARTLLNELTSPSLPKSNQQELFSVETNLLRESEEDIRDNPGLTWADKSRLILKRREELAGWKGTQQAKEGADRIDRALGLVPGINNKLLSDDEARRRDTALTEWYNVVDALPPEERQFKAIEIAEQVTERVIRSNARAEAERIRARMERMQTTYGDPSELSSSKRKEYEAELKRQQDLLRQAEQRAK